MFCRLRCFIVCKRWLILRVNCDLFKTGMKTIRLWIYYTIVCGNYWFFGMLDVVVYLRIGTEQLDYCTYK